MSVLVRFVGGPTALTGSIESHVGKWAEHSLIDAFLSSSATTLSFYLMCCIPMSASALWWTREMKCLKLGNISLDGTKVAANASKHKALSWEHANKGSGEM